MNITIIGSGNMAKAIATEIAKLDYSLTIAGRDQSKAKSVAAAISPSVKVASLIEGCATAEVVILAVPYGAIADIVAEVGELAGKVVVDISNPITPDFKGLLLGHSTSAAEEIQRLIPKANVVKAFNTIFAGLFKASGGTKPRVQTFIAGNDEAAVASVAKLADQMGLQAVMAGELSNSRFIEPIGEMNIHFGFFLGHGPVVAPAWQTISL